MPEMDGRVVAMLHRVSYKQGTHLRGTPLWFNANRSREHCVLTSVMHRLPPPHKRVVAPEALAERLRKAGYATPILPVSEGQWVGFGGQELFFVHTANQPEVTAALMVVGGERWLIGNYLPRSHAEWPVVDHLVLHLPPCAKSPMPAFETVVGQLCSFAQELKERGEKGCIWVESVDVGRALCAQMTCRGHEMRVVGQLGRFIGRYSRQRRALALGLVGSRVRAEHYAWVDTGLGRGVFTGSVAGSRITRYELGWYVDAMTIEGLVRTTEARTVSVVCACSTRTEDRVMQLNTFGVSVHVLTEGKQLLFEQRS